MNDALDLTISDWLIPAGYADKDLRPTIAWEFARESLTIANWASKLKAVLSLLAAEGLQPDHVERLLKLAQHCGYSYKEFFCHSASARVHALNREYVALVKEMDRIMPDTDWRFVLSDKFPRLPIWSIGGHPVQVPMRRSARRNTPLSELQQLARQIDNGRNAASGVYANEFEWIWDELRSGEAVLPEADTCHVTEVEVVIILVPRAHAGSRSDEELAFVISESVRNYLQNPSQSRGVYNGIPLIVLQELVVSGSTNILLSQQPREELCRWLGDGSFAGTKFRGVVIPRGDIDAGRVSPQSIIRDALRSGCINSSTVIRCGGLWGWERVRRETALRRLGALRATSAGLTFSEIGLELRRLSTRLGREAEQLPEVVQKAWCDAQLRFRPDYNKSSALYEAAEGALKDFRELFPALEGEQPRAFLRRSGQRQ